LNLTIYLDSPPEISFDFLLNEIRLFYLPQREKMKEWPSPFEVLGKVLRETFVLFDLFNNQLPNFRLCQFILDLLELHNQ